MDLGSTHDSSIVVEGYERLKAHFGVSSKTEIMQRMTRAAMVDEVLQKLGIDTRAVILGVDVLEALFDAVLEVTLRIAERELTLLGPEVDVVRCGDDLGGQTGLQISYDHYARFIKPRHAKFFRKVKELTPAKLMFHSCGSIVEILDDLVDIGVDIINPVQVSGRLAGKSSRHVQPCPGICSLLDTTINSNSLLSQPHPHVY